MLLLTGGNAVRLTAAQDRSGNDADDADGHCVTPADIPWRALSAATAVPTIVMTGTMRTATVRLIAAASTRSYDVTRRPAARTKTFRHPQVGTITLSFQGMQLETTPGHRLGIYIAEPGAPDHDAMILLGMTAPSRVDNPAAHQQH